MAVVIRLTRRGTRKTAFFRIAVMDIRKSRDSNFIEDLGMYDPKTEPSKIEVNKDRAKHWLGVGAKPSDTVKSLFKKSGMSL